MHLGFSYILGYISILTFDPLTDAGAVLKWMGTGDFSHKTYDEPVKYDAVLYIKPPGI